MGHSNPTIKWPKDSQKHDLDPLPDKRFYWDSSQVSRENYAHKYDLSKPRHSDAPHELAPWLVKTTLISMNWARSPQRGTWWTGPLTQKNYAQKYDLTKVHAARTPISWPPDSWKLRSNVWFEQGAHSACTKHSHFWWRLWWRLNASNIVVDIKSIR